MRLAKAHPDLTHALIACAALGLGTSVYLLDRGGTTYFIPSWLASAPRPYLVFGAAGANLPTFAHTFAFALLTAAVLGSARRVAVFACILWTSIDALFELGQLDVVSDALFSHSPLAVSWVAAQTRRYLMLGTFDPLDLGSIVLGGFAAYVVMVALNRRTKS